MNFQPINSSARDTARIPVSVVHVVAALDPRKGGPSRTVVELANAGSRRAELDVTLLTQRVPGRESIHPAAGVNLRLVESSPLPTSKLGLRLRRELRGLTSTHRSIVLHSHGIWLPINHWVSRIGEMRGIPVVIQPRGMLEPWAFAYKAWKKHLAMALFQRRDLALAAALVATSETEYGHMRQLGLRRPIAVIPNGVRIDAIGSSDCDRPSDPASPRTVLFLSRIHPTKGLFNLLDAWRLVSRPGWQLRIAGPDDDGHLSEVRGRIRRMDLSTSVEYIGALDDEATTAAYRSAELFVLPTFSENFGMVVAEALAHGVPVITTRAAPWEDLETYRCGWWTEVGVEPLAHALREAMALTDEERRAIGRRGQEYVRRYNWDEIAHHSEAIYRWILGCAARPDCVRLD